MSFGVDNIEFEPEVVADVDEDAVDRGMAGRVFLSNIYLASCCFGSCWQVVGAISCSSAAVCVWVYGCRWPTSLYCIECIWL